MATYGVLGTQEIRSQLNDIFNPGTASQGCIDAASYNLRVAPDGTFFSGNWHPIGDPVDSIVINPGEMAVLSTIEEFTLPEHLTGSVNIKFKYTRRGLLSLFGSRVDPGYDRKHGGRRLYLFVCNIGSLSLSINPGEPVFIVEFSTVTGTVSVPDWNDMNTVIDQYCKQRAASGEKQLGFLSDYVRLRDAYEKLKDDVHNLQTTRPLERSILLFAFVVLGVALLSQLAPIAVTWWQRYLDVQPIQKAAQAYSDRLVAIGWPVISVGREVVNLRRLPGDSPQVDDILMVYRPSSGKMKSLMSRSELQYVGTLRVTAVESENIRAVPVARTSLKAIRTGDFTLSMEIN